VFPCVLIHAASASYVSYGRQEQLKRESLSASELLLDLRKRKPQVTLLILDACRDHPFIPPEQKSLSWGSGLVRMDAPAGTFIMYSAGAGETALDRLPGNDPDKEHSIYTRKLLSGTAEIGSRTSSCSECAPPKTT
jgi:Caspase domain